MELYGGFDDLALCWVDIFEDVVLPQNLQGEEAVIFASVVGVCFVFYELLEASDVVEEGDGFGYAGVVFVELEVFGEVAGFFTDAVGVGLLHLEVCVDILVVAVEGGDVAGEPLFEFL